MKDIALITYLEGPDISPDDSLLIAPLWERGIRASAVPWDSPDARWESCDALVLRSCWNYHRQPRRFRAWVERLHQDGIPLWNSPTAVLWNMDKRYLGDLEDLGIPIVPTVWPDGGPPPDLDQLLGEEGWEQAVVKPCISASAYNAWQVSRAVPEEDRARFVGMSARQGLMVQKLMPEITDGEWSLVYLEGKYSHAVLKRPPPGGIFVQEENGGVVTHAIAADEHIEQGARIIAAAEGITGSKFLYARVDGILVENCLTLMELEVIEPSLFMHHQPESAERFAEAIERKVS